MSYLAQRALSKYQDTGIEGSLIDASPHRIIQLMMQGALDRIDQASAALSRNDIPLKAQTITYALRIIEGLRASLDHEKGAEISHNFDTLYEYMTRRLAIANAYSDPAVLDEVSALLREIKQGWDAITPQVDGQAAGQ